MSEQILYCWPPAARFGRVVPKSKFYKHAAVTTSLRKKFVADVQRVVWAYKLADTTIHLRGDAVVPEIQVFVVDAKDDDVGDDVLAAIDKAVQFPIIFEINSAVEGRDRVRMVATYKQLDGKKPRLSDYFSTDWLPADTARALLPTAVDLPSLYSGLLASILPFAVRPGEPLAEATARVDQARRVEREIMTLKRKLDTEPQLNRRVLLRRELRDRTDVLTLLCGSAQPSDKDNPKEVTP